MISGLGLLLVGIMNPQNTLGKRLTLLLTMVSPLVGFITLAYTLFDLSYTNLAGISTFLSLALMFINIPVHILPMENEEDILNKIITSQKIRALMMIFLYIGVIGLLINVVIKFYTDHQADFH